MRHSAAIAGIALGGALAFSNYRHEAQATTAVYAEQAWLTDSAEHALRAGQPLPPLPVPPQPAPRREQRSIVANYGRGMLWTGALTAALLGVVLVAVVVATGVGSADHSWIVGIIPMLLLAVVIGVVAAVVPGLFVGIWLSTREQRVQVRWEVAAARHRIYADHDRLRHALEAGQTTPVEALACLLDKSTVGVWAASQAPPAGLWSPPRQEGWRTPPQQEGWGPPPQQQQWGS